jgi:hypothetical protein
MPDTPALFVVRGRDLLCSFSHCVNTPTQAIAKVQEMIEDGLKELTVSTPDGRNYDEADFAHLIKRS